MDTQTYFNIAVSILTMLATIKAAYGGFKWLKGRIKEKVDGR
jgi:hypothetical protein